MNNQNLLSPSPTVSFADVAHQTLIFDGDDDTARLILELVDTKWMQRLRRIRQTGNTHLVYMFAEHSRFGHSLGVAYLALLLMQKLERFSSEMVAPYRDAVAVAALLHDIGHCAPGSHLAARIWSSDGSDMHERISARVITEDEEIRNILDARSPELANLVCSILEEDPKLPAWTHAIISGGGWNADRGNWTIVDSAMCSVSYGRYNVAALIDAFRLSESGRLILLESRLDALTHFFVARDSMYRQVYLHRVMQAADVLAGGIVKRLRDLCETDSRPQETLAARGVFCDDVMSSVLQAKQYGRELQLHELFEMTEPWWSYHLAQWCSADDTVLRDLSLRLRDRRLLKTVRLLGTNKAQDETLHEQACSIAESLGFDPKYYIFEMREAERRGTATAEQFPPILRDDGSLVTGKELESIFKGVSDRGFKARRWIALPKEVKEKLGRHR